MITSDKKKVIIIEHQLSKEDTGSPEVQIALSTARINDLQGHFKIHKQDFHSRRGLLRLVSHRRNLLNYLKNKNFDRYKDLIEKLGLRH